MPNDMEGDPLHAGPDVPVGGRELAGGKRDQNVGRPTITGTPEEVIDIVAGYRDVGVDELIVPDWTMGPLGRAEDTCDLFMERVVPAFR